MMGEQNLGEAIHEAMVTQLIEGLKSKGSHMVALARELAKRDPNMAEALRRYDAENVK
jgi:hypothetical protein